MNKILKFGAPWCTGCVSISKTIETLSDEEKAQIVDYNIDNCDKELISKYNIRGVPALVVLNDQGGVIKTATGNMTKKQIIDLLGM